MPSSHDLTQQLELAWNDFDRFVRSKQSELRPQGGKRVSLIPTRMAIEEVIDKLETKQEFNQLIEVLQVKVRTQGFHKIKNSDVLRIQSNRYSDGRGTI